MNPIKRWFIERWLKSLGWRIGHYPFPRGTSGCQYSVYWHSEVLGGTVGDIEWATEREHQRVAQQACASDKGGAGS